MKIQIVDPGEEYVIETIDLSGYDLVDESDVELLKNDLFETIIGYIEDVD